MGGRVNPRLAGFARDMRKAPTPAEAMLWRSLRNSQLAGLKFSRQIVIGMAICDFVCRGLKLVIEVDGETHTDRSKDERRDQALIKLGYQVLRFTNDEVRSNLDGVLRAIMHAADAISCPIHPPTPSLEGRGGG
ncbi:hypothetical protein BSL82_06330 [Tardibacter chloracetimidivorans]|uniref:DUF559 domain-containing protein n=1 Tax=Tardibacter chloracetimidivorans TaxID=1921510 RepID=A0A1L3ZTL3_9SPHN|nr:endonuclease domain-containing protein [Tardibacter chloracetimidivorans]API58974.1 hypothetical protein BSL82_06330 [Tardibacter chloracetimidivorans]